jgi:hypothetical protein
LTAVQTTCMILLKLILFQVVTQKSRKPRNNSGAFFIGT